MMLPSGTGHCQGSPALAVHNGQLWCLWVNKDDKRLYYVTGDGQLWGAKTPFVGNYWTGLVPDNPTVGPALAGFNGVLHAAYSVDGNLIHYQFDETAKWWGKRCIIARSSATPVLCAFDGRLFCAFQGDGNKLIGTSWNPVHGWMPAMSSNEATWGSPTLYMLNGLLCLLAENDKDRRTKNTAFNTSTKSWSRQLISAPNQKTAYGVSVTGSSQDTALMAFQSDDSKGLVLVDTYSGGSWQREESAGGVTSQDTLTIAALSSLLFTMRATAMLTFFGPKPPSSATLPIPG